MGKFKPGTSGNPAGRPKGARYHDPGMLLVLKAEEMRDGYGFLTSVYRRNDLSVMLRTAAAQAVLKYERTPCTDRRVSRPIDLPKSDTVELALANIAELKDRAYKGFLGLEEANLLIQMEEATIRAIESTVLERDFRLIEGVIEDRSIPVHTVVSGGLPGLQCGEGENPVTMPDPGAQPVTGPWGDLDKADKEEPGKP